MVQAPVASMTTGIDSTRFRNRVMYSSTTHTRCLLLIDYLTILCQLAIPMMMLCYLTCCQWQLMSICYYRDSPVDALNDERGIECECAFATRLHSRVLTRHADTSIVYCALKGAPRRVAMSASKTEREVYRRIWTHVSESVLVSMFSVAMDMRTL